MHRHEQHCRDQAVLIIPDGDDPPRDVVCHWVADALVWVPAVPSLRVAVVMDELVANARRHGRLPCVVRLSLDRTRRNVLVFVDDSAASAADCVAGDVAWPAHAGLTLVDALTLDWGVEPRTRGKTVWARVPAGVRVEGLEVPPQPLPG